MSNKRIYPATDFRWKLKEALDAAIAGEDIYIDRNRILFRVRVDKKSLKERGKL